MPCDGFSGEVPLHSSFVMTTDRARSITAAVTSVSGSELPAHEVVRIDDEYVRLKVYAADKAAFQLANLSFRCKPGTLVATASWKPVQEKFRPKLSLHSGSGIEISWPKSTTLGDTRVDWAFSQSDLARGHFSTSITETWLRDFPGPSLPIATGQLDGETVFIRATRYRPNGTEQVWKGWAYKATDGKLRSGEGTMPSLEKRRFETKHPCKPDVHRKVPVHPSFERYSRRSDFARDGVVETQSGRQLPFKQIDDAVLEVDAPLGTVFRIEYIPRSRCPEFFEVVTDDFAQLAVATAELGAYINDRNDFSLELELKAPLAWPKIEVRWSEDRQTLGKAPVNLMSPQYINFSNAHWANGIKLPSSVRDFYVELTPLWSGDRRGSSLVGKVSIRIGSEQQTATFKKIGVVRRSL